MSFTYDFNAAPTLSRTRLLVADTDATHPLFTDDEVNAALQMESSQGLYVSGMNFPTAASPVPPVQVFSVYRAAALLLDALAADKSRLAAVSQLLDVKLGHDAAAEALRKTAEEYRDVERKAGHFAIAEQTFDIFASRDRIWKQLLRLFGG